MSDIEDFIDSVVEVIEAMCDSKADELDPDDDRNTIDISTDLQCRVRNELSVRLDV